MIIPFTIRDGEAVALWSPDGNRRIVLGPKVVFAPFKKVEPLHRVVARDSEYLKVLFCDGRTEHRAGPCELWIDPLLHNSVDVRPAINLDAHQAVVVYRDGDDGMTHRILRGPALFVPQPNECLHRFRWHGDNGKGQKVPGALQFEKLRVIPDQMYFDVEGVRTADEALMTVRLMVFFELTDIERMLAQTHDPIADFINGLSAHVIRFAGTCDTLILGAWGCGAFEKDPSRTAQDFRKALETEFPGAFSQIVFAITDWSPERHYLGPFRDIFSG